MIKERLDHLIGNKLLVGYVSDLEGNLEGWYRYLKNSRVLQLEILNKSASNTIIGTAVADSTNEFVGIIHSPIKNAPTSSTSSTSAATNATTDCLSSGDYKITLKERCLFVFGGDVCDRGSGDLQIIQDMLSLKERYPDRVYFILGNRDVNKLRLPVSLHPSMLKLPAKTFWVNENKTDDENKTDVDDRVERLKWILKGTMGSPYAFECRREELQRNNLPSTDNDVVESFLRSVLPGPGQPGILLQYLTRAQLSFIVSDILFVHGAINDYYLGWVPPSYVVQLNGHSSHSLVTDTNTDNNNTNNSNISKAEVFAELRAWSSAINDFATNELQHYSSNISNYLQLLDRLSDVDELTKSNWDYIGGYSHPQPASRLIQCGMGMLPDKSTNPSIIYNSYLASGKPVLLGPKAAEAMKRSGLNKVVVGHQPNGDLPLVLDHLGVQVVCADNSYSKFVKYNKAHLFKSPSYVEGDFNYHNKQNNNNANNKANRKTSNNNNAISSSNGKSTKRVKKDNDDDSSDDDETDRVFNFIAEEWIDASNFHSKLKAYHHKYHDNDVDKDKDKDKDDDKDDAAAANAAVVTKTAAQLADTRDALSFAEVCASITSVEASELVIHGRLSNGAFYAYKLPPNHATANTVGQQSFVGRATEDGDWYVKASGVVYPHEINNTNTNTNSSAKREEELYYVLSASEGFTFKNKIVNHRQLLRELRMSSANLNANTNNNNTTSSNNNNQDHNNNSNSNGQGRDDDSNNQHSKTNNRPRSAGRGKPAVTATTANNNNNTTNNHQEHSSNSAHISSNGKQKVHDNSNSVHAPRKVHH